MRTFLFLGHFLSRVNVCLNRLQLFAVTTRLLQILPLKKAPETVLDYAILIIALYSVSVSWLM